MDYKTIMIEIPFPPISQPRPRFSNGRAYLPAKYRNWKKQVVEWLSQNIQEKYFACKVSMTFVLKRPKHLKEGPRQCHFKKPDIDNLCKAILDCLQESGIIFDDKAVWQIQAEKVYAGSDEKPKIEVFILKHG